MKIHFFMAQHIRTYAAMLAMGIAIYTHGQYAITGDATQTIDFSSYEGDGFSPNAATAGTLDTDTWSVDLTGDGQDWPFNTASSFITGDYNGGEKTGQYNTSNEGDITCYSYNGRATVRMGARLIDAGSGQIEFILRIQNGTGGEITGFDIAYDLYSRNGQTDNIGEAEFYYSSDNSIYTEITDLGYIVDGSVVGNTNWDTAPNSLSGSVSSISISNGSDYYFKWVLRENNSTANNMHLAFTNIQLTATIAAGSGEGTITGGSTNFGTLGSTTVADPGEDVFDFTIADDASTGSDAFPIQFTDVVFTEGASDGIDDWSDVIAGARLEDAGGNAINATAIGTNSITFSGIGITSSDVGYVADDGSETYTLSVWLNTSITEEIDGDLLHISLSGADFTFSGATSTITVTESAESSTSYNTIAVTGTNWGFDSPPTTVGVDEDFTLVISAVDAYGNIDLDDNASTFILSRGTTGSNNLTEGGSGKTTLSAKTLSGGKYTYSDLQYDASEDFDIDVDDSGGSYLTSTTSSAITAAISYQSAASGDWTTVTNWEFWNGSTWTTASNYPTSTTGTIYIRNGTTMSVDVDITADQVVIESGGVVNMEVNNANLTVADGPGDDLIINNGGTLNLTRGNSTPTITGTILVESGGTVGVSVNAFNGLDDLAANTQVSWQTDAVLSYTNTGGLATSTTYFPSVAAGTYPIFEVNGATSFTSNNWVINGVLKVSSATMSITNNNVTIRDGIQADGAVTLTNVINMTGSTLFFGGTGSIDLNGQSYSLSGVTIEMTADQEIYNGTLSLDGSSTFNGYAYSLNDGSNDNLNVTVSNGATINCEATAGLATTFAIGGTPSFGSSIDYNFSGSSAQTLNFGSVSVTQANRVTVDNSSGVTLNSDLTINERLTLTNGIFSTSSSSEVITISSAAIIVGASSTNYFDGPLEIQGFSSSYTFHVGDGADYRPVTLDPVNSSDFTVAHITGTPTDDSDVTAPVTALSLSRYWTITRGSGTGNVEVTLDFSGDGVTGSTDHRVSRYNTGTTSWEEAGTGYDSHTSSTITSTTSDFSDFTLATTTSLLPVELLSFAGESTADGVLLSWETASELNNDYFEVQHSEDGTQFQVIGQVTGAGTVKSRQDYQFIHRNPVLKNNFYRLRQVDFDGAYEYSPAILVDLLNQTHELILLQNPVSEGQLQFQYRGVDQVNTRLLDTAGRVVRYQEFTLGTGTYTLDVSTVPTGIYLLFVNDQVARLILK